MRGRAARIPIAIATLFLHLMVSSSVVENRVNQLPYDVLAKRSFNTPAAAGRHPSRKYKIILILRYLLRWLKVVLRVKDVAGPAVAGALLP